MKKNVKNDPRSLIEKIAEKQALLIIVWMVFVLFIVIFFGSLAFWAFNFFVSGYLLIAKIAIPIICLISFIVSIWKIIKDSSVIIPENHMVLLECFNKFVGNIDEAPERSKGVIKSGLHFIFPYFNIFKIHNNATYFLGDMGIELFKNINKKTDFTINLIDTSVNLSVVVIMRIFNPILCAYNVDNYQSLIIKKCESAITKKANKYNLNILLEFREFLSLDSIFPKTDSGCQNPELKVIEESMGVKLLEIIITDIGVQKKDQEYKAEILLAESKKKAADIENAKLLERGKTNLELIKIETLGDVIKIRNTKKAEGESKKKYKEDIGFDNKELLTEEAISSIKDSDKLIVGGKNGASHLGAEIAFGSNLAKDENK